MTTQKWGGLASFILAVIFIDPMSLIYLTTPYPAGRVWYQVADFLSGPLWVATLIIAVIALRERIGERAPHRMSLVQLAATFAAVLYTCAAILRSVNRDFVELHSYMLALQMLRVITVGLTAAGWHFLGWALLILGSVTWTTREFPRGLSAVYLVSGVLSLFRYLGIVYIDLPYERGTEVISVINLMTVLLCVIWAIWQGIFLWRADTGKSPALIEHQQPA